jgi:hypothetical protein
MPGIPANITIPDTTIKGRVAPLIDTARPNGYRANDPANDTGGTDPVTPAGLFFSDTFDAQADWNGSINADIEQYADQGHILPTGWDAARSTVGWPAFETVSVKSGAEFTRSGTGKAFVHYRSKRVATGSWVDGILAKTLPAGTKKVFARFWIRFQPGFTNRGLGKLFRIQGWDGVESYWNGTSLQPSFIWSFYQSGFGSRLQLTRRSNSPDFNFPEEPLTQTRADGSLGWTSDTFDLNDDNIVDNNPVLINQLTGLAIPYDQFGVVDHSEFMGDGWHKMEVYVDMNSAPGVSDGKLVMWLDDQLIFRNLVTPWIQSTGNPDKDWRAVKLGGNWAWSQNQDDVGAVNDADQLQEWYAIDEVEIHLGGLPEGMSWASQ